MCWMQLLISAFVAVLFLQSGLDKVFDRDGNAIYLREHFRNSPLLGQVDVMLTVVTVFELIAGTLSGLGALALLFWGGQTFAYAGAVMGSITILMLFFGQRVAKDYAGAAVLVPYFLLTLVAIHLLQ
ncbi:MAG: DoxX family protein [Candidatus Binatia bacterium]